jgi:arginyl-tRNA synthetase
MLSVKQELLGSLAAELERLSPGAGGKAVFESPKVAAHGDFACTAAMQLAKPLKLNPRQLAEALRSALLVAAPFQQWVDTSTSQGPGFINIRLKPAAKQQIVREVLATGACFGQQPANGRKHAGRVCVGQPDRPAACGPWPPGRARRRDLQPVRQPGLGRDREFYYNDAGVQIATLANSTQLRARGLKPGDAGWPEAGLQRRLHRRHCQPTSWPARPCMPTTGNSPPAAM